MSLAESKDVDESGFFSQFIRRGESSRSSGDVDGAWIDVDFKKYEKKTIQANVNPYDYRWW